MHSGASPYFSVLKMRSRCDKVRRLGGAERLEHIEAAAVS
jgi:hypothetical protein